MRNLTRIGNGLQNDELSRLQASGSKHQIVQVTDRATGAPQTGTGRK